MVDPVGLKASPEKVDVQMYFSVRVYPEFAVNAVFASLKWSPPAGKLNGL